MSEKEHTPAPLTFIDTETDGVHPGRKVWEIAIVRREPNGAETAWETFVEIDLSTADPFGLRVGRFWDRHPVGRVIAGHDLCVGPRIVNLTTVADRVVKMTHGAHLVGAVPNFDAEVLDRLLRAHGLIPAWHYHLIDIENLAVGYLNGQGCRPRTPPWSSDNLTWALDVEPATEEERHTAMGDVRWAMRMYDAVMGQPMRADG